MVEESKKNICMSIPFLTPEHASIACDVLAVDKELKSSGVNREISCDGVILTVNFQGADLKKLRVAVNAFLKNVLLIVKTINLFHEN